MNIEKAWKNFLKDILINGEMHEKDDGDILQESLINHCMIDNPLKQIGSANINSEMFIELIKKGAFDIKEYPFKGPALVEYVASLDDPTIIDGRDFVYTYPERIFNILLSNREKEVKSFNQFDIMVDRLKNFDGSNRAVATLYSAGLDHNEKDIPCLNWLQSTIRNNKLLLHVMFRSNDCYGAFPSNMFFISYIGLKLTEELKKDYPSLEFSGINYNSTSLHIYKNDIDAAKKVVGF